MGNFYKILNEERKCIVFDIVRISFIFILFIFLYSPLIGTIFNFINISWGFSTIGIISILSAVSTFFASRLKLLEITSWLQLIMLFTLLLFSSIIYLQYSPVLELRQDPSIYTLKAFNLVNFGSPNSMMDVAKNLTEQGVINSLDGYAAIQNGTKLIDGMLYSDFYPGGSYFSAFFGMFNKSFVFLSQSLIMLLNTSLMFFIVNKIFNNKKRLANLLLVACFFISPIIVFFGRGSYSEPVAMVYILLLINILLQENGKKDVFLLMLVFLASYSARIDNLFIILIGMVVISYKGIKYSGFYCLLSILELILFKQSYFIYYERIISNDSPFLKYGIPFIIIAFIVCFIIIKWGQRIVDNIFYSKWFKFTLIAIATVIGLFMFYDNLVVDYHTAEIHGNVIMTYKEFIWDLLFMVFPSVILIVGLFNFHNFIDKKKVPFLASGFMICILVVYLYFFINAGNSPQLYWMLRRYYNIILPLLFISFIFFVSKLECKNAVTFSLVVFLLSTNMFLNSNQIPDYDGIDSCIRKIDEKLTKLEYDLVLYDEKIRFEISPIMTYSSLEFIPVDYEQLNKIIDSNYFDNKKVAYISLKNFGIENDEFTVNYLKMTESYGEVPDVYDNKIYKLYVSDLKVIEDSVDLMW